VLVVLDDELVEAGSDVAGSEETPIDEVVVVPADLPLPHAATSRAAARAAPPTATKRAEGRVNEFWGERI
jgi:hypothetical protein